MKEDLENEKIVIMEEIKTRDDQPEAIVWEKLMETAFHTHRYRRPIIGEESVTSKLTREDLIGYYNDYYRPDNTILIVAGDVDPEDLVEKTETYFGSFSGTSKKLQASPPEEKQGKLRLVKLQGDIVQKYIAVGFHMPPFLHDDAIALEIIAGILTDGKSSRLYQSLREAWCII